MTSAVRTRTTGFLLACIAAITYGMNPLFAVPLYADGMNPDSVLLFRYLFAIPVIGVMVVVRGRSFRMPANVRWPSVVLGLLIAISSLTLFMSYEYMNSGIASTLLFVYPILVALLMGIFFHERITLMLVICILVTSLGIALLCNTSGGATLSLYGSMLVGISALTYAIYLVAVSRPHLSSVPTLPLTFWMLLFGALLFIVRTIFFVDLTLPSVWYHWFNLIGLALFPTAISFICTTRAIQLIGSTPTAILGALEPVSAIFFGIVFLGQGLTPREMAGLALVIIAVMAVIAGSGLSKIIMRVRKMFPRKHKNTE